MTTNIKTVRLIFQAAMFWLCVGGGLFAAELVVENNYIYDEKNIAEVSLGSIGLSNASFRVSDNEGHVFAWQLEDADFDGRKDTLVMAIPLKAGEKKAIRIEETGEETIAPAEPIKVEDADGDYRYAFPGRAMAFYFSKKNAALRRVVLKGQEIPLSIPAGYWFNGPGGGQGKATLKVWLEEGAIRSRINFEGPVPGLEGGYIKGCYCLYPDGYLDFSIFPTIASQNIKMFNVDCGIFWIPAPYFDKTFDKMCWIYNPRSSLMTSKMPRMHYQRATDKSYALLGVYSSALQAGLGISTREENLRIYDASPHSPNGVVLSANAMFNFSWDSLQAWQGKEHKIRFLFFDKPEDTKTNLFLASALTIAQYKDKIRDSLSCLEKDMAPGEDRQKEIADLKTELATGNNAVQLTALSQKILALQDDMEKSLFGDIAAKKETLAQEITSLKGQGLYYQPVVSDLEKADNYIRLSEMDMVRDKFAKRMEYERKALALLAAGQGKAAKIMENKLPPLLLGQEGKLMIGVCSSMADDETVKALRIKFFGNMQGNDAPWVSFLEENKFQGTMLATNPDARLPGWFLDKYRKEYGLFKDPDFKKPIETIDPSLQMQRLVKVSPSYHEPLPWMKEARKMFQQYVEKYKGSSSVACWWNWGEPGWERELYHPVLTKCFQVYLRERYKDIKRLNEVWSRVSKGATYAYTDFTQITPPDPKEARLPGFMLRYDWQYFRAKTFCDYLAYITEGIKEADMKHPVILLDYYSAFPNFNAVDEYLLDKAQYLACGTDLYPGSWGPEPLWYHYVNRIDSRRSANWGDPVYIGEQAKHAGNPPWPPHNAITPPERLRNWHYTAFLHGVIFISEYKWRTGDSCLDLLYKDGTPTETAQKTGEMARETEVFKSLYSVKPERKIALYYPRMSAWLGSSNEEEFNGLHRLLLESGCQIDIIDSTQIEKGILERYKGIFFPPCSYLHDAVAEKLERFIMEGGLAFASSHYLYQFNEWGEAGTNKLARLVKEAKPMGRDDLKSLVLSSSEYGKGKLFLMSSPGKNYIRNKEKRNAIRESLVSLLPDIGGVFPDREGIESAFVSNDKATYLMVINHNPEPLAVNMKARKEAGRAGLYDIVSLKRAGMERKEGLSRIKVDLDAYEAAIFLYGEKSAEVK